MGEIEGRAEIWDSFQNSGSPYAFQRPKTNGHVCDSSPLCHISIRHCSSIMWDTSKLQWVSSSWFDERLGPILASDITKA